MTPLAATVHLINSNTTQEVCFVGFLQTRHQELALSNFLWSHVHQLEGGLWICHSSHDHLSMLLRMMETKHKLLFSARNIKLCSVCGSLQMIHPCCLDALKPSQFSFLVHSRSVCDVTKRFLDRLVNSECSSHSYFIVA